MVKWVADAKIEFTTSWDEYIEFARCSESDVKIQFGFCSIAPMATALSNEKQSMQFEVIYLVMTKVYQY